MNGNGRGEDSALIIAFCGPSGGAPEIVRQDDGIVVYGWAGSGFIALQDSRVAGTPPSVEEIVIQELEIAGNQVEPTRSEWPVDDLQTAQYMLDHCAGLNAESQSIACGVPARLAVSLAEYIVESDSSHALIWEIVRRVVGTQGLFLAELEPERQPELWTSGPIHVEQLIGDHAISAIAGPQGRTGCAASIATTMPHSAETESGRVPQ